MMTETFTKTVLEIIKSTIPNKIITCNDKDPPWTTPEVKTAIKRKHRVYKKYVARGRRDDELDYMKMIRNDNNHLISRAKESYFEKLGKKLCDPSIGIKSYWMTIKKILNKSETSVIPPLFVNGVFVTNFQTKLQTFRLKLIFSMIISLNNAQ